jgi:hypothetical protein
MVEKLVGKISEFKDGDRRIVPTATIACTRAAPPARA